MKTHKFARKPFYVDAVRVREANLEEVAEWCGGTVDTDASGHQFITVKVHRPLTERQTQAYIGDWVLYAGNGFKVYTPKAFDKSFEKVKTLTKEQADEAGISVPHEKRPDVATPLPRDPKKGPVPTAPKTRRQKVTAVGEAMREAQAKVDQHAEKVRARQTQVDDDVIKTSQDKLIDPETAEVTPAVVETKSEADREAEALIAEVRGDVES